MAKDIPEDINPKWMSVIRRLQSVAKSDGLSVITIRILVDANGIPQAWTAPETRHIEPKSMPSAILSLSGDKV